MPRFCGVFLQNMYQKVLMILLVSCLLMVSCEKEIKLNLPAGKEKLVVEGSIEYNDFPLVILTNSSGFFGKIDLTTLKFVRKADITVTDLTDGYSFKLIDTSIKVPTGVGQDSVVFAAYIPDIFSQALDARMLGRLNHTYQLDINAAGEKYTAVTKIPDTRVFDSIWLEPFNKQKPDSASQIRVIYTDPDTLGDYHRYETQVRRFYKKDYLDESYLADFGSVFNDAFTNGKTLPFYLELGSSRRFNFSNDTQRNYLQEAQKIFPGDTVNIKWSGIDYNTYEFWQTLEYSRNSTGNPFAAPTKIKGNISNGAIGAWSGYGSKIISIIAPR
jgi:hypothetical protein